MMYRIGIKTVAALGCLMALGTTSAGAVTIANPTNSYNFSWLSGSLTGGNQTQYIGQTFTAPITGDLTDFQFTLNTSSLQSMFGIVYAWNGTNPTTELWRSATIPGATGLVDFHPTGVKLMQGQTYVAFLSTFGLADNSGLASLGSCLTFVGCGSNTIPNLGTLIYGNVQNGEVLFNPVVNNSQDTTFSVTIAPSAAIPEPASWALMMTGFGAVGAAMRRRRTIRTAVRFG